MRNRKDIDSKYKWNLKNIYKSEDVLREDIKRLKECLPKVVEFKGKLNSPETLLEYYKYSKEVDILFDRVFIYIYLNHLLDTTDDKYNQLISEVEYMAQNFEEDASYVLPELNSYDVSYLESLLNDDRFKLHHMGIKELIKQKPHILSHEVETAISKMSKFSGEFSEIYDAFDCIDLKISNAKDSNGNEYEVTKSNYGKLMLNEDRTLRKNASTNLREAYKNSSSILASTYIGSVKKDCFYSDVYRYKDSLFKKLDAYDLSEKVYYTLIDNVNKNVHLQHEWYNLKKEFLGYDKLYGYDLRIPLAKYNKEYSFDEAKDIVLKALSPLGQDYVSTLKYGFDNNWVDVYPTLNKDTGGSCIKVYGVDPHILLNFENTFDNVSTIAHEFGHALNDYYTEKKQPYEYNHISVFMGEMASTTNEVLLNKYMYNNAKTKEEKIYFLQEYINLITDALFGQTMYSEFEDFAHKLVENEKPITREILFNKYEELCDKYNGDALEKNEYRKYGFLMVPHFYRAYYVFTYATGVTCAFNFANMCLKSEDGVKKYKEFLSSGSSDYALNILKNCGIDLETDKPYEIIFKEMKWAIDELKSLI